MTFSTRRFRFFAETRVRRAAGAALFVLAFAGVLRAEQKPAAKAAAKPVLLPAARAFLPKDKLYPVPFAPGETLVFTVAWLKVEGGEMSLALSRETTPDGVPVHHVALKADSNDYISKFYPVRTRYETWVDARDFQPLRFEKRAR